MPIHYAALLNKRNVIVLQGIYKKGGSNFKTSVTQFSNQVEKYQTHQVMLDDKLILIYRN